MDAVWLPLHLDGLVVQGVHNRPHELLVEVASDSTTRPCPRCGRFSGRVHSDYLRWLARPCDRPVNHTPT